MNLMCSLVLVANKLDCTIRIVNQRIEVDTTSKEKKFNQDKDFRIKTPKYGFLHRVVDCMKQLLL
jgi:hypothetical protein